MFQPRVSIFSQASETRRKISRIGGALMASAAIGASFLLRNLKRKSQETAAVAENAAQDIYVTRAVTVNQPVEDVYRFWHDLTNLPQVMEYVESVYVIGNTLTHWTLKFPGDLQAEFDAETYIDMPNEMISWRSLPESEIQSGGSVRLQPVEDGTEVQLTVEFVPPAGALGQAVAKLFGEAYVDGCLDTYKQMVEQTSVEIEAHGGV
jgi:uncharacterized membrane protein